MESFKTKVVMAQKTLATECRNEDEIHNTASGENAEDDDEHFDTEIEDWLAKRNELDERNRGREDAEVLRPVSLKEGTEENVDKATTAAFDVPLPTSYTAAHPRMVGSTTHDHNPFQGQRQRYGTVNEEDEALPVDASARVFDGADPELNWCLAELSTPNDELLVIEGVRTADPRVRRAFVALGAILFTSLVALTAGMVTTRLLSLSGSDRQTPPPSNQSVYPLSPNQHDDTFPRTVSPLSNPNWTITEFLSFEETNGVSVGTFLSPERRQMLFSMANRTDTNYTAFAVLNGAKLFEGLGPGLLSKAVLPIWTGHVMDALENIFVPGHVLHVEDMHDGMVLTSLSGHNLVIQLNPLRMNNITVSTSDSNIYLKNGIMHRIAQYPNPVAPWIGKSLLDVLWETNDARDGDLSDFLALIDASPNITNQLELRKGDTSATTLFVPTNDAMVSLDSAQLDDPSLPQQLLLNHTVAGNFAKRFWEGIPTGTQVSSTELTLETQAGQVLVLSIDNAGVTINGVATIVQSDIFCEQGILQVIDKILG